MYHQSNTRINGNRPLRVALYSHDTMGLGHVRRNLLIAQVLRDRFGASVLVIAGAHEACAFHASAGVDFLALPALFKEPDARYRSRRLDVALEDLTRLRSRSILGAVEGFQPDLFVADNVPRGACGELVPALEHLRAWGEARVVLGLRDVLDDAAVVRSEWARAGNEDAIRDYYDAVWVYGDPRICDPRVEYGLAPDVAAKVRFVGYLDQRIRLEARDGPLAFLPGAGRMVLCALGGGQDGAALAETFLDVDLGSDTAGVLLTGPLMCPREVARLRKKAASRDRFRVVRFAVEGNALVRRADRIVAMGGYNTVCSVLSFARPALIVPRVAPRREQLIRAERMSRLGLVDVLHPARLDAAAISRWLAREICPPLPVAGTLRTDGADRLPHLLEELLSAGAPTPAGDDMRYQHAAS